MDEILVDFARRDPDGFARAVCQGTTREMIAILEAMPADRAASIVARLPAKKVVELLNVERMDVVNWLNHASLDDAVKLAGRLPRDYCLAIVNELSDRDRRRALMQFLNYPAHSVGAVVSDALIRIPADTPVPEVLAELRELGDDKPGPIVLTEADGRYFGLLNTWPLVMADKPTGRARDYADPVPPLHPEMPLVHAASSENWRQHGWLPVVDYKQRVIGVASRNRVLDYQSARDPLRRDESLPFGLLRGMAQVFASLLRGLLAGRVR